MSTPRFAQTKIQPPRLRPGLIERPRLEQPLGEALARQRLVLLTAPAGFGKTAALTRRIAALPLGTALAWISADAEDDLGRFAACLVAALDPCDLPWRSSPDALVAALDGGRETRKAVASELLNALLAADVPRGLIVLEDAHRIEDPAVFEFIALLVERLPDHWGFVIASRVDPRQDPGRTAGLAGRREPDARRRHSDARLRRRPGLCRDDAQRQAPGRQRRQRGDALRRAEGDERHRSASDVPAPEEPAAARRRFALTAVTGRLRPPLA